MATDGVVMVQEPSVDLTNGILLDLYRFVDRSEHRKIVGVGAVTLGRPAVRLRLHTYIRPSG